MYFIKKARERQGEIIEKEKKKMGRPSQSTAPRNKKLTLNLSEEELQDIAYISKKLNMSRTDSIVKSVKEMKKKL